MEGKGLSLAVGKNGKLEVNEGNRKHVPDPTV